MTFDQAVSRTAGRFRRVEPRATARAHVVEHLGADDGVLIVDEIGFLKKGRGPAGVRRRYTGTAGRIENSRIGGFLVYASHHRRSLTDRQLCLPERTWCEDAERRTRAGVLEQPEFATKPTPAGQMIVAALDAGAPPSGRPATGDRRPATCDLRSATCDEAYGQDPFPGTLLESCGIGCVPAVACSTRVRIDHGRTPVRADTVADHLPDAAWHRQSAGAGAKGPRSYGWVWIGTDTHGYRHLLIRRNPASGELAFHLCWSPRRVPLPELVRVAGTRWCVEECFQAAKSQAGPDHYQVRHWAVRHRHIALAMPAPAFLTVLAAGAAPSRPAQPNRPARSGDPVDPTVPEIRHLPGALPKPPGRTASMLPTRSAWRRQHRATARRSHYRRRLSAPPPRRSRRRTEVPTVIHW
ncbi:MULTISPECIES: IS701 family transposase [unclassified Streptomyces]|uniref:IS701 family transposase n=1 Tax=unclassified Streptomyces TaxID=2593676 RepID=UPI00381BECA4